MNHPAINERAFLSVLKILNKISVLENVNFQNKTNSYTYIHGINFYLIVLLNQRLENMAMHVFFVTDNCSRLSLNVLII